MKFTFIATDESYSVQHYIEAHDLFSLLDYLQNFLKGCGYEFDGRLGIESDNEYDDPDTSGEELYPEVGVLNGIAQDLTSGPVSVEEITKEQDAK